MSIMRCFKHDWNYDSDFRTECPACENVPVEQELNWRKIWRAMHDLQYKRTTSILASMDCIQAGLNAKQALALCAKTQAEGYVLSRDLPKQN